MLKNKFFLGAVALVAGYVIYKKFYKKEDEVIVGAEPKEDGMSNAVGGSHCRCKNGTTGYCKSGDCASCCGEKDAVQRRYKF
jgi:hypothetical protein